MTANQLHYTEAGDGPPLILLHGSGPGVSGASNFAANLPAFSQHFRTLMLDMPGFGDRPEQTWTKPYPEHAADAILTLMDQLDIHSAQLLGNSMDGWVALEMAYLHPQRVDELVLMGPEGCTPRCSYPHRPKAHGGCSSSSRSHPARQCVPGSRPW